LPRSFNPDLRVVFRIPHARFPHLARAPVHNLIRPDFFPRSRGEIPYISAPLRALFALPATTGWGEGAGNRQAVVEFATGLENPKFLEEAMLGAYNKMMSRFSDFSVAKPKM
jgi:hypothetical protein